MHTLVDIGSNILYGSIEEIVTAVEEGKKSFTVSIPNDRIEGLRLELFVPRRVDALYIRLADGAKSDGCHLLGEFNSSGIAELLAKINDGLIEGKYALRLKLARSTSESYGGCPYYNMTSLSINGEEIVKEPVQKRKSK